MKIRTGFVSNSSSTSYLVVGVERWNDPRLAQLAIADEWEEDGYGVNSGKTLLFIGSEYDYDENDNPTDYEPYLVGIDAENALKAGIPLNDIKEDFIARAKALGVEFTLDEVELCYGEASSE